MPRSRPCCKAWRADGHGSPTKEGEVALAPILVLHRLAEQEIQRRQLGSICQTGQAYRKICRAVAVKVDLTTTGIKEVSFDVLGSNLAIAGVGTNPPIYFTVDVASIFPDGAVRTGVVGATIAAVAGVPEPASWALMISGFGMAGAALRRRRAMVAA